MGQKIGVGKKAAEWVKTSNKIWNGHASIGKNKSLFIKYVIERNIKAITKLWEKSYKLNTQ